MCVWDSHWVISSRLASWPTVWLARWTGVFAWVEKMDFFLYVETETACLISNNLCLCCMMFHLIASIQMMLVGISFPTHTWMQSLTYELPHSKVPFQLNQWYWWRSRAIILFIQSQPAKSIVLGHPESTKILWNKLPNVSSAALMNWHLCKVIMRWVFGSCQTVITHAG